MKLEQNCGLVGLVRFVLVWDGTSLWFFFVSFFVFIHFVSLSLFTSVFVALFVTLSDLSVSVSPPVVRPSLSFRSLFRLLSGSFVSFIRFLFRSSLSLTLCYAFFFRSLSVSSVSFVHSLFHPYPPSTLSDAFLSVLAVCRSQSSSKQMQFSCDICTVS